MGKPLYMQLEDLRDQYNRLVERESRLREDLDAALAERDEALGHSCFALKDERDRAVAESVALRSMIRAEHMPEGYDVPDDATTELAVELAATQARHAAELTKEREQATAWERLLYAEREQHAECKAGLQAEVAVLVEALRRVTDAISHLRSFVYPPEQLPTGARAPRNAAFEESAQAEVQALKALHDLSAAATAYEERVRAEEQEAMLTKVEEYGATGRMIAAAIRGGKGCARS